MTDQQAEIHHRLGPPPLWAREPGFPTLVHIILEQQVSLASARAAFIKLDKAAGIITPRRFLQFDQDELKQIGFSRQKAAYCRALAESIENKEFNPTALEDMDDLTARESLIRLKGVGPWSADIYLLMSLLRADIWPASDLALSVAIQELKVLPSRPDPVELDQIASAWKPWRAVAARQLWQYYLNKRGLL